MKSFAPLGGGGNLEEILNSLNNEITSLRADLEDAKDSIAGIQKLKIGSIIMYSGSDSSVDDFLLCDGSAVSRTIYADLFNVIGTTYGSGDGSSTFNLPNDVRPKCIVDSGSDASGNWWRQWSDGWIEQGGNATTGSGTITLSIPYNNSVYTVLVISISNSTGQSYSFANRIRTRSETSFTYYTNSSSSATWYAAGQGATTPDLPALMTLKYMIKYQ